MKKILVTGGAGYIGSHTCKALKASGYEPVVFDNLVYGHREAVRWGELVVGDLKDPEAIAAVIAEHRPEAVIHFAAYAYVGESVTDPAKYYANNVVGTLNLLEAMRAQGVDRIVFSSTCATYGVPESVPIRETTPQNPINPYGASKLMIERVLKDYDHAYALRSVALRYFNASGADPDGEIGEGHDPETHLVPLVLYAAQGRIPHITVHGDDYDTPDGTCIRDYIHVADLASAHVKALQWLERGEGSSVFNLGNGRGFSVKEVIAAAEAVTGKQIPVVYGPRRAGDPPALVADAKLAYDRLGWKPQHTEMEGIIRTAWNWHAKEAVTPV
jgi:UDP-arabinose 4-epimerase